MFKLRFDWYIMLTNERLGVFSLKNEIASSTNSEQFVFSLLSEALNGSFCCLGASVNFVR